MTMPEKPAAGSSLRESLVDEPVELRFGTSGRRGNVVDLSQLEVYLNARAELEFLAALPAAEGGLRTGEEVAFAFDLRPSSTRLVPEQGGRGELAQAVVQAIRDAGFIPANMGCIPTPALMHHAIARGQGSIMVTGSHIPFERNGYKVNTAVGELLKHHEAPIGQQVARLRARLYAQPASASLFDERGMLKGGPRPLPAESDAARLAYLRRYADFFAGQPLAGRQVLVYQHSAVGRDLLVEVLERLGARVFAAGRSETFVPIDTENVDARVLATIQSLLDEAVAAHGPFDAVVSTDGDSDRPLILGLEPGPDGKGQRPRFFGGDLVGTLVAQFLDADAVVVPISCNDGIDRGPLRDRLEPKTRIGSPHVIAGMLRARARGRRRVVGWEANGGFLTGSALERDGRTLSALPTRDALLPILAVLAMAARSGGSVASLFAALPPRFSKAALLGRFPRSTSEAILRRFSLERSRIISVRFEGERASGRDADGQALDLESATQAELRAIRVDLEAILGRLAAGPIETLDWTDGLRAGFANGEIAHVRPSGNADELRIYAVADSQERADAIAALGVAEPDGLLRGLERAVS